MKEDIRFKWPSKVFIEDENGNRQEYDKLSPEEQAEFKRNLTSKLIQSYMETKKRVLK